MDKRTMVAVAAILSTLNETGSSPASILYVGLGMDHSFYMNVQVVLASAGLVTVDGSHRVSITATGRALAVKIDAATRAEEDEAGQRDLDEIEGRTMDAEPADRADPRSLVAEGGAK